MLRAEFARRLSDMYGQEVPAYRDLVEVSEEVNRAYLGEAREDAERLGSISRVTAERHGAIRVGTPDELRKVARLFAAFGMYPVGFYDLRDTAGSGVPVVSTAFRPIRAEELALNPFRVFTSMLVVDDPRFFDSGLREELWNFLYRRELFGGELLELADHAADYGGLGDDVAEHFLELAVNSFVLSNTPIDYNWHKRLESVSSVAADIGGVGSTHINHLTPRVLDIDDLYNRMESRGIRMIDDIQGPPKWDGPDVLLRQTSFRALSEDRIFRFPDGSVGPDGVRVRFGEVEQRGIALTRAGRELYDFMLSEVARRADGAMRGVFKSDVAREVWAENLPDTEEGLAAKGLAFFVYDFADGPNIREDLSCFPFEEALRRGLIIRKPIVYEDFLPKSAAGIFRSNLEGEGRRDSNVSGTEFNIDTLSDIIGRSIVEPTDIYNEQQQASIDSVSDVLSSQ